MLKTGAEHLESLRDGRVVYIGSERVDDVTAHPAFRNGARSMAAIYDLKSSHYFEENFSRGEAWYRSHFPTRKQRAALRRRHGAPPKVGEAAPLYMFHPLVPARVAELMPQARMIVLLRDPVERAYSQHAHAPERGIEHLVTAGK